MPKSQFEKEWTGVALFFEPTSNYQAIHTKEQTLLALLLKLVTHRGLILTIVLVSLLMTLTSILNSYFLQVVIDRLIPTKATTTLTIIACGLLIAYVFNSLFLYLSMPIPSRPSCFIWSNILGELYQLSKRTY